MQYYKNHSRAIYTNKAKCRDCNRCVRHCPVKAIRIENGQAQVIPERCISCGSCILECPQHAKTYRRDVEITLAALAGSSPVAVSIAPSFAGIFTEWEQKRLPSALRMAGFSYIEETALGAYQVAQKSKKYVESHPDETFFFTACPVFVSYVEKYQPELIKQLVPISSPMLAHGKMLREKYGNEIKVVFVGPCIAKKEEIVSEDNEGIVNIVLTYDELKEIFHKKSIDFSKCEESAFDNPSTPDSRLFPLEGGMLRTSGLATDMLNAEIVVASGFEEIANTLKAAHNGHNRMIVEPLFCRHGCINGPAAGASGKIVESRHSVIDYSAKELQTPLNQNEHTPDITTYFTDKAQKHQRVYSEKEILAVLNKTGKLHPEDELNCGACGYNSCREKAIAVLEGLAEVEMCVSYMKRLAEQRADMFVQTDPNGIVILDSNLKIVGMNPAFKKMFSCSDSILGQHISYLVDPYLFEKIASGAEKEISTVIRYEAYSLICHQILYSIPEENRFVGIFVNITDFEHNKDKLKEIRSDTVTQAQELIDHQIAMAQELVRFLGENTAKSEVLLSKLIDGIKK